MKKLEWRTLITALVIFAVYGGLCWLVDSLFLPAISIWSTGFWVFIIVSLMLLILTNYILMMVCNLGSEYVLLLPLIVFVVFAIGGLSSWNVFHAKAAREVMQVTKVEDFKEGFSDILESSGKAFNNLSVVDYDMSKLLGDKKIAGVKNATWYDVDKEYNLIKYQNKYYRLSVIDYGGFFKYWKAKQNGIPGYVLVDVVPKKGTITEEAMIVERPIRYSPGAFFEYDLKRHIRFQFRSAILDKSYLEIDEEGTPFWITGVKTPTQGLFGVPVIKSVIITNAETGESYSCSVEDVPKWVDHVFSLSYLMKNAHNYYAYVNGYWNNKFSKTGVYRLSYDYKDLKSHKNSDDSEAGQFANFYGYSSIVGSDGDVYLYTGLTSANNAESNLGWVTINTRTGAMTQYDVVGAEEGSAQAAVETLVQAQRYEATFPLPVNIGGEPCYLMALKGKSGLVQGYGIVNVENYSIAVFAETLEGAIDDYLVRSGKAENAFSQVFEPEDAEDELEVRTGFGEISAIYSAEIDGTTQFYYVINEELYRSSIMINEEQVLFVVGDKVQFDFRELGKIKVITSLERKK